MSTPFHPPQRLPRRLAKAGLLPPEAGRRNDESFPLFRSFSLFFLSIALLGACFIGVRHSENALAQGPCSPEKPGQFQFLPINCVPTGLAGVQTYPAAQALGVTKIWDVVNRYIAVFLPLMAALAVAIIVLHATHIVAYASNDTKRKEATKSIQWVLFGLLGSTLAYMIITSLIRGFYKLASGG